METEFLPRFGDDPGFVENHPGNRGGIVIGQFPAQLAVEITDRDMTLNNPGAVILSGDPLQLDIMFVIDRPDNFLKDIFKGDDAAEIAVFINDNGNTTAQERLQLVDQQRRFGTK